MLAVFGWILVPVQTPYFRFMKKKKEFCLYVKETFKVIYINIYIKRENVCVYVQRQMDNETFDILATLANNGYIKFSKY